MRRVERFVAFRLIPWGQRHRRLWRVLNRPPFVRDFVSRCLWRELDRDPAFRESLAAGQRDHEEGRWYSLRRNSDGGHDIMPNPDWPADGEQPDHPRGEWEPWA